MKAAVENLASEQVHEDSQAAEENCQAQKEELEDSGEHDGVSAQVVAILEYECLRRLPSTRLT